MVFIFIFLIVLVIAIFVLYQSDKDYNKLLDTHSNFAESSIKDFKCTQQLGDWGIDAIHHKICFISPDKKNTVVFSFNQIMDIQVTREIGSKQKGNPVTRAVVGGILTGGIGAVVGAGSALSHKEYCKKLTLKVMLINDLSIEVDFLNGITRVNGLAYRHTVVDFNRLYDALAEAYKVGHPESHYIDLTTTQ